METMKKEATRFGFYEGLVKLAEKHSNVYALDADLSKTTGSVAFLKAFPERYIDVGIAEQNMVGISAGLSRTGLVPFCSSMAVFAAGRAFEIIRNSVCYPNLNVKIIGSHGGITAAGDGGTHQCIEDIGIMRTLPRITVLQPCDSNQARQMAQIMYDINGPVYLRTSREPVCNITSLDDKVELGKAQTIKKGKNVAIIATGMMTVLAWEALSLLEKEGVDATLINIHTIKPFDSSSIIDVARNNNGKVLVCEEGNHICGLTEAVASALVEENNIKLGFVAINDEFGQSGQTAELLEKYGITKENIAKKAMELVKQR